MSIADKLQYTLNAKNAIKDALVTKGVLTGTEPFDEYAGAVTGIKGMSELVGTDCKWTGDITIPDGVTMIGSYAFNYCTGLISITIPDSVVSINSYAFSNCTGLTSAPISNSVKSIGSNAFFGCTGLISITIPDTVTAIENGAFRDCTSLTAMVCQPTTPPSLASTALSNTRTDLKIYVPDVSVDAYKTATNWVAYADKILPLSQLPTT